MNNAAEDNRYRLMTDPLPAWRRVFAIVCLATYSAGLLALAYWANAESPARLLVIEAGWVIGFVFGLAWAVLEWMTSLSRKNMRRFMMVFVVAVICSRHLFLALMPHQHDTLGFFVAHLFSIMAGFFLGILPFAWKTMAKPQPLIV